MKKKLRGFISGVMVAILLTIIFLALGIWTIESDAYNEDEVMKYLEDTCEAYEISPELVQAIIERESKWNPGARNGRCIGIMQIDPSWHVVRMRRLGVNDLTDTKQNILVGVDYLHELFEEYKDVYAVLMFYNGRYSSRYGIRAYMDGRYSEYAEKVISRAMELEILHGK